MLVQTINRETIITVLMAHFPIELRCDEEAHTDECICACGSYTAPKMPSIGQAVRSWAEHVAAVMLEKSDARL